MINNKIYIGVHYSQDIENDSYMGSGKLIVEAIKKYGIRNFKREIWSKHRKKFKAYQKQSQIVNKQFVKRRDTYNLSVGGVGGTKDMVSVKDKTGNTFKVFKDDQRFNTGEIEPVTRGFATVKDKSGKTFQVSCNDERLKTGQLVGVRKGLLTVESSGMKKTITVQSYDKNIHNYHSKGKVTVKDKSGKTFQVQTNDPRYLNGQLKHHTKGKFPAVNKNGDVFFISKDDQRYISGQLVAQSKGRVPWNKRR